MSETNENSRKGGAMEGLGRVLLTVNRVVVAAALAAVFAIVFANVVGRYVFSHSFAWVEELARHLLIFCAF
ncbi:MAG: TRAP transporter small permease subunit [Pseudomonadota bacterium]